MLGFNSMNTVFDNAVNCLLGSSLDDFFSNFPPEYAVQRKTIHKGGHTIVWKRQYDQGLRKPVDLYYVDGKCVDKKSAYELLDTLGLQDTGFEDAIPESSIPRLFTPVGCNNKLPKDIVNGTNTPHMDMVHTAEGNLVLTFALAGVPEKNISIQAENDYLIVEVSPEMVVNYSQGLKSPKAVYLQKGIHRSEEPMWKKVYIDPTKYNINSTDWDYKDGMLTIVIKKTEEAKTRKVVFKSSK